MKKPDQKPFAIDAIAAEKAKQGKASAIEWTQILQKSLQGLRGQDVEQEGMEQIARACRTPDQFAVMVRLISQHCRSRGTGKEIFALIRKHRDQTVFSLTEWIDALEFFTEWLAKSKQALDFENMLNYLQCCTHLPEAKTPGAKLVEILKHAVTKYGVSWAAVRNS